MIKPINPADDIAGALAIEEAIFEAALELVDAVKRREFLDRIFHGDPQGRRSMEELLEMAGSASNFFLEGRVKVAELTQEVLDMMGIPQHPKTQ